MPRLVYSAAIGFLCVLLVAAALAGAPDVSDYKPVFIPFSDSKGIKIAIREFTRNNKKEFLYVNPETFSTGIAIWDEATFKKKPIPDVQKTPFAKALEKYDSVPITLQNHGLKKAEAEKD